MMKRSYIYPALITATMAAACKKPYAPAIRSGTVSYLVVEGVIDPGPDSTVVTLSKTVKLNSKTALNPESGAQVTVESDKNAIYPLFETGAGRYAAPDLNLDNSSNYRLRIKTEDGQEYLSDFVPVKNSPPIDSIGYSIKNNGVQVYVNSHDASGSTRYYRWDYEEAWQFHSQYKSFYYSDGLNLIYRNTDQQIYFCYGDHISDDVVLGSSAKLDKDVIYQNPVIFIPSTSEKLESEYGIVLREYALTESAYKFWNNIRTNSEALGSIFDSQPTELIGNIRCLTNAKEPVIGYVSAGSVQKKKFFVSNDQLPQSWSAVTPYQCQIDTFRFVNRYGVNEVQEYLIPLPPYQVPIDAVYQGGFVIGYTAADSECIDCTLRGKTTPPAFWTN